MSIKIKKIVLAQMLLLAIIWNCLCIVGLIPFSKWPFSCGLASIGSLIVLIPLLFPSFSKADEKSKYYPELVKKEKVFAGTTIGLLVAWLITVLACIVYEL